MSDITKTREWQKLQDLAKKNHKNPIKNLLQDKQRLDRLLMKDETLLIDFSKNNIPLEALNLLIQLLQKINIKEKAIAMFKGDKINFTEKRSVLHTALRSVVNVANEESTNRIYQQSLFDSTIQQAIKKELLRMKSISEKIITKQYKGITGKPIEYVVNIGIGGSYLGIKLVIEALDDYKNDLKTYFIANIDGLEAKEVLEKIDPEKTLFIIASKSFTTIETLTNAKTIKKWLQKKIPTKDVGKHFFAITANKNKAREFGIGLENILHFGDYIGGRYSLFSTVGFAIVLNIGYKNFTQLLSGAKAMDIHFLETELENNLPVMLAILGIWQINFLHNSNHVILPYCHHLRSFPQYLQQLDMESNGKSIDSKGKKVPYSTGAFLWGEVGTNGQHSFYQCLHQGVNLFSADFIGVKKTKNAFSKHQKILLANMLAQSEALAQGLSRKEWIKQNSESPLIKKKSLPREINHRLFAGNKPSTVILLEKLTPYVLGYLIALYEHKIFTQGVFWGINSFDQWGVELGKSIATKIEQVLNVKSDPTHAQGWEDLSLSTQKIMEELKK